MRSWFVGFLIVVGMVIAFIGMAQRNRLWAEGDRPNQQHLIALSSDGGEGHQQVTIVDSRTRVMSVYHIEYGSGAITLKSVRNIEADMMMDEFNTDEPLPREIRAMLNNRPG